jgi:hypothetical protein
MLVFFKKLLVNASILEFLSRGIELALQEVLRVGGPSLALSPEGVSMPISIEETHGIKITQGGRSNSELQRLCLPLRFRERKSHWQSLAVIF